MRRDKLISEQKLTWLMAAVLAAVLLTGCGPSAGPYRDYYVQPYGEDAPGRGTESEPWRTVQYALDHAEYTEDRTTRINLQRGVYQENIQISQPVILQGVGRGHIAVGSDPLIPLAEVSAIFPSSVGMTPLYRISGAIDVEIYDLTIAGGKMLVDRARLYMSRVDFVQVTGLYGLSVEGSPTTIIEDVSIATRPYSDDGSHSAFFADLGIRAIDSVIEIRDSWIGDVFDHPIDLKGSTIATIENNEIEGSFINNADGIRLTGDVSGEIIGNQILRLSPDNEPGEDSRQWPHAGIAFGGDYGHSNRPLVHIEGNTIAGFDVGIGITTSSQRIRAQNNDISGNVYDVAASERYSFAEWWRSAPVVDFGEGYLGSEGGNIFHNGSEYGVWLEGEYNVDACNNDWQVPDSQVPERIYDLYDDSSLGVVYWDDCDQPRQVGPNPQEVTGDDEGSSSSPLVEGPTPTPTPIASPTTPTEPVVLIDTLCWRGPGPMYEVVSSLAMGTQVQILGRGVEGDWWVLDNPRYPGVRCWTPGEDIEVLPNYDYPDTLFEIPPLPTPTPILGCRYYDQQKQEACFPINQCPVDFEDSLGACTP